MAAKETLTEYERQRLENIRRNSEMIDALMIRSKGSELSALHKRGRSPSTISKTTSKRFKNSPPRSPTVIRRSLRTRGLPPTHSGYPSSPTDSPIPPSSEPALSPVWSLEQIRIGDAFIGETTTSDRSLLDAILTANAENGHGESNLDLNKAYKFDPISSMTLKPENVARVVPDRIYSVQFLPFANRTVVAVGSKQGNVGFWDLDFVEGSDDGDGIYVYLPHSAPVSGISVHPLSTSKIFTASYDGLVRKMDVEKETFNVAYSTEKSIFSICHWPCDIDSLFIGEGAGVLKLWDERAGKASNTWNLHEKRINTIDFNQKNLNLMATCSSDGTACIWDQRYMKKDGAEPLKVVNHKRAVNSAYFSPNGGYLATTSFDDNIGILNLSDLSDISMIHHHNQTGRWLPTFRASWGWDDSFLFLGNMKRAVDIISTTSKTVTAALQSPEMSSIPCRFAAHQSRVGTLACATAGGNVFLWTNR